MWLLQYSCFKRAEHVHDVGSPVRCSPPPHPDFRKWHAVHCLYFECRGVFVWRLLCETFSVACALTASMYDTANRTRAYYYFIFFKLGLNILKYLFPPALFSAFPSAGRSHWYPSSAFDTVVGSHYLSVFDAMSYKRRETDEMYIHPSTYWLSPSNDDKQESSDVGLSLMISTFKESGCDEDHRDFS